MCLACLDPLLIPFGPGVEADLALELFGNSGGQSDRTYYELTSAYREDEHQIARCALADLDALPLPRLMFARCWQFRHLSAGRTLCMCGMGTGMCGSFLVCSWPTGRRPRLAQH